jgi:AraC-like DNA-binding protein
MEKRNNVTSPCKGIMISSNTDHSFFSNQDAQIFFLIDNTSINRKQLNHQYLRSQSFYVIDDQSINLIRRYYSSIILFWIKSITLSFIHNVSKYCRLAQMLIPIWMMFHIFSGESITEAAMMAGFDSSSHLAAVAKKTWGMSAKELNEDSVFSKVSTY